MKLDASPGMMKYCTTAGKLYDEAKVKLAEAEDAQWDNPNDQSAGMRVRFWTKEVHDLSVLPADQIIPLH